MKYEHVAVSAGFVVAIQDSDLCWKWVSPALKGGVVVRRGYWRNYRRHIPGGVSYAQVLMARLRRAYADTQSHMTNLYEGDAV